jgi:hypothetical protein
MMPVFIPCPSFASFKYFFYETLQTSFKPLLLKGENSEDFFPNYFQEFGLWFFILCWSDCLHRGVSGNLQKEGEEAEKTGLTYSLYVPIKDRFTLIGNFRSSAFKCLRGIVI